MRELIKQEMKNVIEGNRTTERIPNLYSMWIYPESFEGQEEEMKRWKENHICDAEFLEVVMPQVNTAPADDPEYCWLPSDWNMDIKGGLDAQVYLEDWEDAEKMYARFPSPEYPAMIPNTQLDPSKYILAKWWYCLFERHWSIRGMENALTDFYLYPEEVHCFYQHLTDFYMRMMERVREKTQADGIFVSDDIGTQTGPFFSQEIFRTFFKPYYKQLIEKAHKLGMHFWLHSCGNIEAFLEDLIEIGLDVIHPIQKHTMEEAMIARKYGGRICFLVGFDVQRLIPFGTPKEVRDEVRYLTDIFQREDGRLMFTMGNASTKDWKVENLEALFEETERYGKELREKGGRNESTDF